MTTLLAISIGPVQDFIAAARKTNDLKAGSALLSELATIIARELKEHGTLIFPAIIDKQDAPNKLLIELHEGKNALQIVQNAKQEAIAHLKHEWRQASQRYESQLLPELATEQIETFLDFYAAWVPLNGNYRAARSRVETLLAGRKALRNFPQIAKSGDQRKSPLDPSRDTVLLGGKPSDQMQQELGLKKSETLDAISLLKRIQGRQKSDTPSTSLMAARLHIAPESKEEKEYQTLARELGLGNDWSDLLFPERAEAFLKEKGLLDRKQQVNKLRGETLQGKTLSPYYVILAADGDKMGKLLDAQESADQHRTVSKSLSEFAAEAKMIVNAAHGYCIYAGGDDVLALLPLHTAIECAKEIAASFKHHVNGATLSVGIAIVHHLENLQVSLQFARAAEKLAKKERNSLAVALHTRGGAPLSLSEKWSDDPAKNWATLTEAYRSAFPPSRGVAYELQALVREWEKVVKEIPNWEERFRAEALRILKRKTGSGETHSEKSSESLSDLFPKPDSELKAWETFTSKLVIARFLTGKER